MILVKGIDEECIMVGGCEMNCFGFWLFDGCILVFGSNECLVVVFDGYFFDFDKGEKCCVFESEGFGSIVDVL